MRFLSLQPLTVEWLPHALELDRLALGGLWSADGYLREIESPNSDLLMMQERREVRGTRYEARGTRREEDKSRIPNPEPRTPNLEPPLPTPQSSVLSPQHSLAPILALGCSWAILEEAHITIVAVHPNHQRQGLGQAMLVALLAAAHERGLERATLEVRASNESAISLYQKFGFKEAGRRKRYYQDTGEDALVMWLSGLHHLQFPQKLVEWRRMVGDRLAQSSWQLKF